MAQQGGCVNAPRARRAMLSLFVLALLCSRATYLLAGLDPVGDSVMNALGELAEERDRGAERPLYDQEELFYGTAALAILNDLGLPLRKYQYTRFGGGSLIVTLLAVPLYWLFGPYYLVYKLIPLAIGVLGACAWTGAVHRWLGTRAAGLLALLFVFAPSNLVRNSLLAHGNHAEALSLLGGVFYLGSRAALGGEKKARLRFAFAAGALAGLGVYVTYAVLPILIGAAFGALAYTRGQPRRLWLCCALGLALGLIPWIAAVLASQGLHTVQIYGRGLLDFDFEMLWTKLQVLVSSGLLSNYDLPGGQPLRQAAGWLFALSVAIGWAALARAWRNPLAFVVLAATASHLAAFLLRTPDVSPRYVVPAYGLLLMSVLWPALARNASRWRLVPCIGVAALGLAAQVTVISRSHFPALRTPLAGVDWPYFSQVLGARLTGEQIRDMPERLQPMLWIGSGWGMTFRQEPRRWPAGMRAAGSEMEGSVVRGIGIALARHKGAAPRYLESVPSRHRAAFLSGVLAEPERLLSVDQRGHRVRNPAAVIESFAARDRAIVMASLSYPLAVVATHAVEGGRPANRMAPSNPEILAFAAGRALYRGILRFWQPAVPGWVSATRASLQSGTASRETWIGVAESFARDLHHRSASWLVGGQRGPAGLGSELARVTRGLAGDDASLLYCAAGTAVARALATPFTSIPEGWTWEAAIADGQRASFRRGLEAGRAIAGMEITTAGCTPEGPLFIP